MTIEQKEYEFSYAGGNYIDVNTLLTSQFHFIAIINELQKELYPDTKLNIKIKGFKEGSFVVQLVIDSTAIFNLLSSHPVLAIEGVLAGFASIITIYKGLQGEKAKEIQEDGNNVTIILQQNNTTNNIVNNITVNKEVFEIYKNNITINNAIQKNFELLEADRDITGIKITETIDKKDIVEVPQEDFHILATPNKYLDKDTNEEINRNQILYVKRPDLFPVKNRIWVWEFLHKGRDIKAKIVDRDFEKLINGGLKLGQGDRIEADLKIFYKWDEKFMTYIESNKFEVVKIHKTISRPDQSTFTFND